jgi:hypothetical protein
MTNLIVIADIGDFIFVAILVIASIAGQIAKASKRQKRGGKPPSTPPAKPKTTPSPFGSADDQLRNFLETLATGRQPEARPASAPAPRQEQQVQKPPQRPQPAPVAQKRPAPRQQIGEIRRPAPQTAARPAVAKVAAQPAEIRRAPVPHRAVAPSTPALETAHLRPSIAKSLAGGRGLKDAIVLREILGPPLSLRGASGGGEK